MEEKEASLMQATETEESVDIEAEPFFQDIYMLSDHGISLSDVEEMRKIGINTIKGLQMTTTDKLLTLKSFDQCKVSKIQEICGNICLSNRFMTALEVFEESKQVFKINMGSANLNNLLGGGVESMSITQVFGESGTGKTQIAHTLCVTTQIPTEEFSGGKVMFIDTEHTFRPNRIRQIARHFNLSENSVLENILYARAYNSEHQYQILKNVADKFHEDTGVFKLLIVDSIMALFRIDFLGRGALVNRQQKLTETMSLLRKISEEYNVAVLITNQVSTNMNNSNFPLLNIDDELKPLGGNVLAHSSTTRIALKKVAGNVRIAKMIGSPELEEKQEAFIITGGGIQDPKLDAE
ncbi:meiotic recombination protein DMC1/LIM15 homolog [Tribolium madens]|uniref:meiotic recombination protein DMC1/LIM15 homolog n=1 Tax=Tribolium madens TaxID=41895 RepID=UPI001CF75A62|nr:meiotic recombination protein DMC1/LIM15 homolog [Tribolium madens]